MYKNFNASNSALSNKSHSRRIINFQFDTIDAIINLNFQLNVMQK